MNQLRSPVQEPLLRLLGSTKGHDYVLALFCLCLVLVILAIRGRLDTRLIPGIPVLGGSDPTVMKCSSERFVHDAKAMLQQGYEQVSRSTVAGAPFRASDRHLRRQADYITCPRNWVLD